MQLLDLYSDQLRISELYMISEFFLKKCIIQLYSCVALEY